MSQVYLIKKGSTNENRENGYLEYVFKDYSEARKLAQKLVKANNKKNSRREFYVPTKPVLNEMQEVSPDKWINGNEIIEVVVFHLQNVKKKKGNNPKKFSETTVNISQEIILSH